MLTDVWRNQGFHVHWVVEPTEQDLYMKNMWKTKPGAQKQNPTISIHPLPIKNGGIGHSRMHCVNLAASWGFKSIVLADDDIKPNPKYHNMDMLVDCASHPKVLGITARYGYHDLCLGATIRDRNDLILLPTGTFRLVALNVRNVLDIGNYDRHLEYAEDCDLFLRGLKAGFPWMIHLGTRAISIGNRYQAGGMVDFVHGAYSHAEVDNLFQLKKMDWHEDLYDRYPEVINDPAKADFTKQNSIRISWQRAYTKYLPCWKSYSSLHGGSLEKYFNGVIEDDH
jgi:hypothetical protein